MKAWLLLLILICGLQAPAATPVGIVPVRSLYSVGNKRSSAVQGAALIFESKDSSRLFALTSSHLSQGDLGQLQVNGLNIQNQIRGRWAHGSLEVIELPKGFAVPLGYWHPEARRLVLNTPMVEQILQQQIPFSMTQTPLYSVAATLTTANGLYRYVPALVPRPTWASSGPRSSPTSLYSDQIDVTGPGRPGSSPIFGVATLSLTGDKFSFSMVTPGMSGEPLIEPMHCPSDLRQRRVDSLWDSRRKPSNDIERFVAKNATDYCLAVVGVTNRYYRDGSGTFFSSDSEIADLIETALSSGLTYVPLSDFRWSFDLCILHREYADGSSELGSFQGSAGSHTSGDPGNHMGGDPGNHMGGDPGSGDDGCEGTDPNAILSQVSGGILWKGVPTYALDYGERGLLLGDSSTHDISARIEAAGCGLGHPTGVRLNFIDLLKKKIQFGRQRGQLTDKDLEKIVTQKTWQILSRPNLRSRENENEKRAQVDVRENQMRFTVKISHGNPDDLGPAETINFWLDRQGSSWTTSSPRRQPYTGIIHVQSQQGHHFDVDVSSLFFADPMYLSTTVLPTYKLKRLNMDDLGGPDVPTVRTPPFQCQDLETINKMGPILKVSSSDDGQIYFYVLLDTK